MAGLTSRVHVRELVVSDELPGRERNRRQDQARGAAFPGRQGLSPGRSRAASRYVPNRLPTEQSSFDARQTAVEQQTDHAHDDNRGQDEIQLEQLPTPDDQENPRPSDEAKSSTVTSESQACVSP